LTKPIGTGVVATAIKAGHASPDIIDAAVRSMVTLNRAAADALSSRSIGGVTDVTGFGLLGHLREMLRASGCSGRIYHGKVPLLPGAADLASQGHLPGGTKRNLADLHPDIEFAEDVPETRRLLLSDAQTSGGLLITVSDSELALLLQDLEAAGSGNWLVGDIREGPPGRIEVV
jgi:selenide,water dikinase